MHGSTVFRITVVGACGVGETSIISQLLYEGFENEYKETIEELHRGECKVNNKSAFFPILDNAGHDELSAMRSIAITNSDAFILDYSLTDESSFKYVGLLRDEIVSKRKTCP